MKPRAFTLIEALILLCLLSLIGVIGWSMVHRVRGDDGLDLTPDARLWAASLGLTVTGVSCMNVDTDHNGYVSCTVATTKGIEAIECATGWNKKGCRVAGFRVTQ